MEKLKKEFYERFVNKYIGINHPSIRVWEWIESKLNECKSKSNTASGYTDGWYVMRNKDNNVIGYGNENHETVKQWCEQMLETDVDYEIIKVSKLPV